jgi:hypothetical protein
MRFEPPCTQTRDIGQDYRQSRSRFADALAIRIALAWHAVKDFPLSIASALDTAPAPCFVPLREHAESWHHHHWYALCCDVALPLVAMRSFWPLLHCPAVEICDDGEKLRIVACEAKAV